MQSKHRAITQARSQVASAGLARAAVLTSSSHLQVHSLGYFEGFMGLSALFVKGQSCRHYRVNEMWPQDINGVLLSGSGTRCEGARSGHLLLKAAAKFSILFILFYQFILLVKEKEREKNRGSKKPNLFGPRNRGLVNRT